MRSMASVLENLAGHYENMATALKESENGEAFTEEELFGESSGYVFCCRCRKTQKSISSYE